MADTISLVDIQGRTSIHIEVTITEEGDLLFSGQDIGEAPERTFGDSDYEYWLRIPADQKDRALLAFLEKLYGGNPRVISEVREYLKSKGISASFSSY